MERVYIVAGARSYIGLEKGMYRQVPGEILGARTLRMLLGKWGGSIQERSLQGVIAGNGAGGGGNPSRLMMLEAGLPPELPAVTVDSQCCSGLDAIGAAAGRIAWGMGALYLAGGFESSSTAPLRRYHENHPDYLAMGGEEAFYRVAKFAPGEHRDTAMLEGAERTAQREGIAREQLNYWALRSHRLASRAREEGLLREAAQEVIPGCGRDEGIRQNMSERLLNRLPCVLPGGCVTTAGNACLTNDGAAFVGVASEEYCRRVGCEPWAELVDMASLGGDPLESPRMAVRAVEALLKKRKMEERDIDVFECNEAFAVIDELFARRYPGAVERYNVLGGALAYGHPYGASGCILVLHAIEALKKTDGTYAVCSIAGAGGLGSAVLLRRCHGLPEVD